ncbi:hypothetical protein EBZ57_02900 [bacterium]|nr:hypothetical protein [bacterium]
MSHIPYYGQTESKSVTQPKNGYEIRAQLIEVAKDYVEKQAKANIDYVEKMQALGKIQLDEYVQALKPYTMVDIMSKAQEMYNFVSCKDKGNAK